MDDHVGRDITADRELYELLSEPSAYRHAELDEDVRPEPEPSRPDPPDPPGQHVLRQHDTPAPRLEIPEQRQVPAVDDDQVLERLRRQSVETAAEQAAPASVGSSRSR